MDCKSARLLLDFARPHARELEAEEADALDGHLDRCSDCHRLARDERQLDEHFGRAMRQVEVPAGLRERLTARLEAERGDWHRRRFAHLLRLTAAAAAVLLLSWTGWRWTAKRLTAPIDPERIAAAVNEEANQDPRQKVEEALKRMGVETPLSPHLNYHLLAMPPALAELPGYPKLQVPMLSFEQSGPPHRHATVYLIAVDRLANGVPPLLGSGSYKVEVLPSAGEPFLFLVVHDGDNLDWLRPAESPAA